MLRRVTGCPQEALTESVYACGGGESGWVEERGSVCVRRLISLKSLQSLELVSKRWCNVPCELLYDVGAGDEVSEWRGAWSVDGEAAKCGWRRCCWDAKKMFGIRNTSFSRLNLCVFSGEQQTWRFRDAALSRTYFSGYWKCFRKKQNAFCRNARLFLLCLLLAMLLSCLRLALVVLQRDWKPSMSETGTSLTSMTSANERSLSFHVYFTKRHARSLYLRSNKIPLSGILLQLFLCIILNLGKLSLHLNRHIHNFVSVQILVNVDVLRLLDDLFLDDGFRFFARSSWDNSTSTRLPSDRRASPLPCKIPSVCQHLFPESRLDSGPLSLSCWRRISSGYTIRFFGEQKSILGISVFSDTKKRFLGHKKTLSRIVIAVFLLCVLCATFFHARIRQWAVRTHGWADMHTSHCRCHVKCTSWKQVPCCGNVDGQAQTLLLTRVATTTSTWRLSAVPTAHSRCQRIVWMILWKTVRTRPSRSTSAVVNTTKQLAKRLAKQPDSSPSFVSLYELQTIWTENDHKSNWKPNLQIMHA